MHKALPYRTSTGSRKDPSSTGTGTKRNKLPFPSFLLLVTVATSPSNNINTNYALLPPRVKRSSYCHRHRHRHRPAINSRRLWDVNYGQSYRSADSFGSISCFCAVRQERTCSSTLEGPWPWSWVHHHHHPQQQHQEQQQQQLAAAIIVGW